MKALILAMLSLTSVDDECVTLGHFAYKIMEGRQLNVPLTQMMSLAENDPFSEGVIRQAYLEPVHIGREQQAASAVEFQGKIETLCYQSIAN